MRLFIASSFLLLNLFPFQVVAEAQDFPKQSLSKDHFIVYHENRNFANNIAWKAEYYYKKILRHLGVDNFHPWEKGEKCIILIFENQEKYIEQMGAPAWSSGLALKDKSLFATFVGAPQVEKEVLPHELTHLILKEYFKTPDIPLWLSEGMAQYEEEGSFESEYRKYTMKAVRENRHIGLNELFEMDSLPGSGKMIMLFYSESASVIDYMRSQLMQTQFAKFLEEIRRGRSVDETLKKVFQWKFPNGIEDFEKRWVEYVKTKY